MLQVEVVVEDVNDNGPVFDVPVLYVSVTEAQAPHQQFFAVHATDADSGRNGQITYKLLAIVPDVGGLFMVHPVTGLAAELLGICVFFLIFNRRNQSLHIYYLFITTPLLFTL